MKTATKSKRVEKSKDAAAASTDQIIFIALENLLPNPYQPATRAEVDLETAKKFALSIQEHGLIQTPVVRAGKEDGKYEIGDGWLRRAGFAYLASNITASPYRQMPCVVRGLTDQQMADMVLEANTVRKDLNPIELAKLYKKYLDDFKITQAELARRHNCSQGEVANTIRLLELPADIQQKIISQEISETHGRQLLRVNNNVQLQKKVLQSTIIERTSVSKLANDISSQIYWHSKNIDPSDYQKPEFDVAGCQNCANRQKLGDLYHSNKKTWRCLDVGCFEKKTEEAAKERIAKVNAEIQAAREQTGKKKDKAKKDGILDISGLTWRDYQELDSDSHKIDNPAQCKTCPDRAVAKFHVGRVGPVCLNVKCFKEKEKVYADKEAAKSRELEKQLTERVKTACERASSDGSTWKIIIDHLLSHSRKDTRERFSKMYGLPDAMSCFPLGDEPQLMKRISAMVLMIERYEGEKGLFRKMLAEAEGTGAEVQKQIAAFQEAHCKSCTRGDPDCGLLMRFFLEKRCYAYNRKKGGKSKDRGVGENQEEIEGKSTGSEAQELEDSLPCKTCANAETCDRSHYYADNKDGYICEQKKELKEASV